MPLYKRGVLASPGNFVTRFSSRHLQNVIASIAGAAQFRKQLVKIGIAFPKGNGAAAEDTILDVHATQAASISSQLFRGTIAEGGTVAGIVVHLHIRIGNTSEQPGK